MTQGTSNRTLGDVAFDKLYAQQSPGFLVVAVQPKREESTWTITLPSGTRCAEDDGALTHLARDIRVANLTNDESFALYGFAHVALLMSFDDRPDPLLLVTERSADAKLYPGRLSLPGGGAHDMSELIDPWSMASREFQEEVVIGVGPNQGFLRLGSEADHTARSMKRLGLCGVRIPLCWSHLPGSQEDMLATGTVNGSGAWRRQEYRRCLVCPDSRTARLEIVFPKQVRVPGRLKDCQLWDGEEHEGKLLHRQVHLIDFDGRSVATFVRGQTVMAETRTYEMTPDLAHTLMYLRQHRQAAVPA